MTAKNLIKNKQSEFKIKSVIKQKFSWVSKSDDIFVYQMEEEVLIELMEEFLQLKTNEMLSRVKQENNPERTFSEWLNLK